MTQKVYTCKICGKKSTYKPSVDRCCKEQLDFVDKECNTHYYGLISKYKSKEEVLNEVEKK